jgi:hypothetical protein
MATWVGLTTERANIRVGKREALIANANNRQEEIKQGALNKLAYINIRNQWANFHI